MPCKNCGRELPVPVSGRRAREYCNNACKQAHYRQFHQPSAAGEVVAVLTGELGEAKERITALEEEISHLRFLLDVERRYLEDTQARAFKAWLRRQGPSPFIRKLLTNPTLPPRGSRALHEAHLRRMRYTADELAEFTNLWKRMLLDQT